MESLNKSRLKISWLSIVVVVLIIVLGFLSYRFYQLRNRPEKPGHGSCLADNEEVEYKIKERKDGSSNAIVFIKEENTDKQIFEFQIENIVPNHYYPYEAHKCGIYLVREFNYDYKKGKPLSDFKMEVWRYYYDGSGEKLVEENDFRVDSTETYLALERSYLGKPSYALAIKDLETKEDIFILTLDELVKKYSVKPASIGLGKWRDNGKYFWAVLFEGSHINAYIRITAITWEVDVLPTPDDYTGGILSSPTGEYIAYDNGPGWVGIQEVAQQIYDEWRKEGKKISLFIYNLFTKEKITLTTIDDPQWDFKMKWISDTELEYELPNEEKKVYKINNES